MVKQVDLDKFGYFSSFRQSTVILMHSMVRLARLAGFLYLMIILFGLIAQVFVRDRLVDYENAAITATNIVNSESWYRFGFVSELIMLLCDVGVTALLFILLKQTSKNLTIVTALFRFASIIILAVTALSHYAALPILAGPEYLQVFSEEQLEALALFSIKLHGVGYNISLLFFGIHLILLGILMKLSVIFPKYLGALLLLGGIFYIINSLVWFQFPDWVGYIYPGILIPCALGEWIFCIFLMVKGLKSVSSVS